MLKVGIIGAGFMGITHLAAWQETDAEIVGIYSHGFRDGSDGIKPYDNLQALINDVDVVDICTPTDTHYELVLMAAKAGKHIICEKPLARYLHHAQEMLEATKAANVQLLVAHVVRFFPEYRAAKRIVDNGQIGDVAVVRLTRASFKPGDSTSWFHDYDRSGGMMLDLMIYDYDYARWVAGDVVSVFSKRALQQFPEMDGDHAITILRHKNNAISHIEGGWAYPKPLFRTALEIAGSAGLIEHPEGSSVPIAIHLKQATNQADVDISVPSSPLSESPYTTQIKHFYRVLTEDETPIIRAEDALASLQIALAAIESAKTGKVIRLEA